MTRKLLMVLSLLLCTGWLMAQEGSMGKGQMGKGDSGQMKVEGCLQKSATGFTLTDTTGKSYDLQGDSAKISEHVGHEVMVTGTAGGGSDSSMSNSQAGNVLQVTQLKHVSKTCKSEGKMSK
jgi:hypothetical protein